MRVYSAALLQLEAGEGHTSATVPDGYVWVIRDLGGVMFNEGDALIFSINGNAWYEFCADTLDSAGARAFQWSGRQVANAGDYVEIYVLSGSPSCLVSGYSLSA